jgi:hypothetical protein
VRRQERKWLESEGGTKRKKGKKAEVAAQWKYKKRLSNVE